MKQGKAIFNHRNVVNLFILYELDTCLGDLNTKFTLSDCLSGAVKVTKNDFSNKYRCGYSIGFDAH